MYSASETHHPWHVSVGQRAAATTEQTDAGLQCECRVSSAVVLRPGQVGVHAAYAQCPASRSLDRAGTSVLRMLPLPHLVAAGDDGHGVRAPPLLARVRHGGSTKGTQTTQQAPHVEGGNTRSLARVTAYWRRRCKPWLRGEHLMHWDGQRGRWSGAGDAKMPSVKGKLGMLSTWAAAYLRPAAAQLMWKSSTLRAGMGAARANTEVVLEMRQAHLPLDGHWCCALCAFTSLAALCGKAPIQSPLSCSQCPRSQCPCGAIRTV